MILSDTNQKKIDAFIAASRKLTGQVISERPLWNTAATADAIRHFAYGISDDNPLWLNTDYAAESRYGSLVAPPAFLISALYPLLHGAPLDVPLTNLIGGLEFEWFQPILIGDRLNATAKQIDVIESEDRQGRGVIYILAETTYYNQRDETVGIIKGTIAWVARDHKELLLNRPVYQYSHEELAAIDTAIHAERHTGHRSPTGVEVEIGQKLPPIVRGPLTIGDLICWQAAIGPAYRAGTLGYRDCLTNPHTATTIPGVGWPVKNSQQHEDFNLAAQRGMPAPFDNGAMRAAWLSVLVTNWMGDEGFLKRLRVSTNAPIIYGDTTWYEGTIMRKQEVKAGTLVTIKIIGANQLGETTTSGEAEVLLPRGAIKPSPVNGKVSEQNSEIAKQPLS
ncbi:MAG TPA: MaoC family dehydratase N-terminal domain-containing protein, partial [Anaerolineae bacterium]|nr:MaoC family dehydratase N-terminal domain-containing protein [Anaerolineae bacterium]